MNDFTKDELEKVRNMMLSGICSNNLWRTDESNNLVDKIQSMIDNYCEHEWEEDIHHLDILFCIKCGKREWWQNK